MPRADYNSTNCPSKTRVTWVTDEGSQTVTLCQPIRITKTPQPPKLREERDGDCSTRAPSNGREPSGVYMSDQTYYFSTLTSQQNWCRIQSLRKSLTLRIISTAGVIAPEL